MPPPTAFDDGTAPLKGSASDCRCHCHARTREALRVGATLAVAQLTRSVSVDPAPIGGRATVKVAPTRVSCVYHGVHSNAKLLAFVPGGFVFDEMGTGGMVRSPVLEPRIDTVPTAGRDEVIAPGNEMLPKMQAVAACVVFHVITSSLL